MSPGRRRGRAACRGDIQALHVSSNALSVLKVLRLSSEVLATRFSLDGAQVALGCADGSVSVSPGMQ